MRRSRKRHRTRAERGSGRRRQRFDVHQPRHASVQRGVRKLAGPYLHVVLMTVDRAEVPRERIERPPRGRTRRLSDAVVGHAVSSGRTPRAGLSRVLEDLAHRLHGFVRSMCELRSGQSRSVRKHGPPRVPDRSSSSRRSVPSTTDSDSRSARDHRRHRMALRERGPYAVKYLSEAPFSLPSWAIRTKDELAHQLGPPVRIHVELGAPSPCR